MPGPPVEQQSFLLIEFSRINKLKQRFSAFPVFTVHNHSNTQLWFKSHRLSPWLLKTCWKCSSGSLCMDGWGWGSLTRSHLEVDMSGTLLATVVQAPRVVPESVIAITQWPFSFFFSLHLMSVTFSTFFIPGNKPIVSPTFIIVHQKLIQGSLSWLSHRCEVVRLTNKQINTGYVDSKDFSQMKMEYNISEVIQMVTLSPCTKWINY